MHVDAISVCGMNLRIKIAGEMDERLLSCVTDTWLLARKRKVRFSRGEVAFNIRIINGLQNTSPHLLPTKMVETKKFVHENCALWCPANHHSVFTMPHQQKLR